jgi:hypothetical protein
MNILDVSALEGRLKPLSVIEPILRMFNSGIWVGYWLFALFTVYFAIVGVGSFASSAGSLAAPGLGQDEQVAYKVSAFTLCVWTLYLTANLAVFSYRRRWAVAALALGVFVVSATAADVLKFGPSILRFDPLIFWLGLTSWFVTNGLIVFLMATLASLFWLTRQQRELLSPMASARLFPRRRFRSMTVLPDVVDFVGARRSRLWISIQYMTAASLFLILPSLLIRSYSIFTEALNTALVACSELNSETMRACAVGFVLEQLRMYVLAAVAALVVGWLFARRLLARAQRRLTFSLEDVTRADPRPPVLFLWSFADDQLSLRETETSLFHRIVRGRSSVSPFEHVIVQRLTTLGPVVALGRPSDTQQPYGAARTYLPHDNWRDEVKRLLAASRYLVIVLDNSEGLLWELEQIAAGGHLSKCIFLVQPRFSARNDNIALLRRLESSHVVPAELMRIAIEGRDVPVLGWFDVDGSGARVCLAEHFSGRSLELLLRWFEKVVALDSGATPQPFTYFA